MVTRRTFALAGLVTAGLALAGPARAIDPTVRLEMGAGMPDGTMRLMALPRRGGITNALLAIRYNPGEVERPTLAALGPGWVLNDQNVSSGQVSFALSNASAQTSDGPIGTLEVRHRSEGFRSSTLEIAPGSYIDGWDADNFPGPFDVAQKGAFVYGKVRQPGIHCNGSVSAARFGGTAVAALESEGFLYLFNVLDTNLNPMPNWESGQPVINACSSRPVFGDVNGDLAVAVGTDLGRAFLFRVSNGSTLFDQELGFSIPVAPAINGTTNDTYWVVQTADAMEIVHQRIGGGRDSVSIGQAFEAVTSSPAIANGMLLLGTGNGALAFRVDPQSGSLTPQSGGGVSGESFPVSPVVVGNGEAMIGTETGKVYKINLATGAPVGQPATLPDGAAPLSDPFYDAGLDAAVFGGADGRLHRVTTDMQFSAAPTSTAALQSPVVVGDQTFVTDANGELVRRGATHESISLHTFPARAMAVTGSAAGTDRVVVNTQDGHLIVVPLP